MRFGKENVGKKNEKMQYKKKLKFWLSSTLTFTRTAPIENETDDKKKKSNIARQ